MLNKIAAAQYKYLRGFHTRRKIVVFESDDWGSIRMPSKAVKDKLSFKYPNMLDDPYMRVDTLESGEDLEALFEVLSNYTDINGKPPQFTANVIMGNPDFDRILRGGYEKYYHQPVSQTCEEYYGNEKTINLWKEGLQAGLFFPQYHGREHLNVDQWMYSLRNNDNTVREAFRFRMISIANLNCALKYDYMESLDFYNLNERYSKYSIVEEGLDMFEQLLGYRSRSFIANCYVWDSSLETLLHNQGVDYMQGNIFQLNPVILENNDHKLRFKGHFLGEINSNNQIYMVRTAHFEPAATHNNEDIERTMAQIKLSFLFHKPAIISTHRLNYVGGIDEYNRVNNLVALDSLLRAITSKWPDVEFMNSVELGDLIRNAKSV